MTGDFEREYRAEQDRRRMAMMALPTVPLDHHATLTPTGTGMYWSAPPSGRTVRRWRCGRTRRARPRVLPDGSPPLRASVIGRGPDLHLLVGTQWYRWSLTDLPRQ
ncbi:MAG TPA: hypothetical protein VH561_07410 [Micromonosporaceae bacterium]